MSNSNKTLVCRNCRVLPVSSDEQPDLLRCPKCDAQGNLEETIELANDYEASQIMNDFDKELEKSFSRHDNISFEKGTRRKPPMPQFIYMSGVGDTPD